MAEIVNDRDLLIMAAVPRFTPPTDRGMFLTPPAAVFRASGDGSTSTPPSFTFKATLLNMAGVVSFAASNGAKLTVNATKNEATLDFAAFAAAGVEAVYVTATITVDGAPYTQQAIVTKVSDGAQGVDGAQTAVVRLYQFSTTVPSKPTGSSTFTWAGAWNGAYTGTDGWSVTVPANPGTPGLRLYVVSVSISGAAKATTTTVSYTGATVEAWAQNGAKGDTGTSGVQSGAATVYQWAATIPAGPAGNALFRWASNSFGEAPSGWTLVPGAAPAVGMTLWAARVQLVDAATNGDTAFNWSTATIMAIGYAGTNGDPGRQGASYVTAYIASSAIAANGAPAQTTGRASLPAANSSGLAGAWSAAVPALADNQRMYQSDGIYDPATDKVTWSIPYWSSLKVATLSAITANLGAINAGSMNLGNGTFTVDNDGNLVCRSIKIVDPVTGETVLQAGGKLNPKYAAAGTLNSDIRVGGRNLYPDSSFERGQHTFAVRSGISGLQLSNIVGTTGGAKALFFDGAAADMYTYTGTNMGVTPGKTYTVSFDHKCATGGAITGSSCYLLLKAADGTWLEHVPVQPVLAPDQVWRRFEMTFTCRADAYLLEPRFGIQTNGAYSWFAVDSLKIEEGTKATAWTPAIEDTDADVAKAGTTSTWAGTTGPGKPQDNATVGAPAGSNVGNTEAQLVADRAYNGQRSWDNIPAVNNELAKRLNSEVSNILRAPITLATGGGVVVGSLTYDASSGLYGSGRGIAITPYGIIGHNGTKYTFGVNGSDGTAFFGGELQAAYGTFGAIRLGTGGYLVSGNGYYGAWNWPGVNQGGGFQISERGMLAGNANDPNMSYFLVEFTSGRVEMPGFAYSGRQLRLDSPVIINPVLSPFNLAITNSQNQYNYTLYRLSTDAYAGLYIATVDTGNDGASFNWTVSGPWPCWLVQDSATNRMQLHINMKGGAALAGDAGDFYVNCAATKGGNTVNTQRLVTVTAS